MTGHDDLDRTLAGWFEADALSPAPEGRLDRVIDATRRRRPRARWLSSVGSRLGRGGDGSRARAPADGRARAWGCAGPRCWSLLLLIAALVGAAILVGARTIAPLAPADWSTRPARLRPRRRHLPGGLGR